MKGGAPSLGQTLYIYTHTLSNAHTLTCTYTHTIVADIPGLIPGAHKNRGLGHSFLRHIERCSCLLYVLDISSTETTVASQYDALQLELELYNPDLLKNIGLIVINKMDSRTARGNETEVAALQARTGLVVVPVSGLCRWNMQPLKEALFRVLSRRHTS